MPVEDAAEFMDHDDRVQRVLALVADINAFPAHYPQLPLAERRIVALAMGRSDWLHADGIESLVQARDEVGMDWSRAVSASRWKK